VSTPLPANVRKANISEAERLAKAHGWQGVVILSVAEDGTVTVTSWAADRPRCNAIGKWAQGLWKHAVTAVPFQTHFGWGRGGRPTPLTETELASLSPAGRQYAATAGDDA
jgi:hypothetical protein